MTPESSSIETYPANTTVQLFRVPWDSGYVNMVHWSTQARNDYFAQQMRVQAGQGAMSRSDFSHLPFGQPVNIEMGFNEANRFNYLTVDNRAPGDTRKMMCYFIVRVEYVAPDTTRLFLQLDEYQTWGLTQEGTDAHLFVEWGRSYIDQGHVGVADTKATVASDADYGRSFLTMPEGLDTGDAYAITRNEVASLDVPHYSAPGVPTSYSVPCVMVTSTIDLTADLGTVDGPKVPMANGTNLELGAESVDLYLFRNMDDLKRLRGSLRDKPWAAQGITSVTILPSFFYEWSLHNGGTERTVTIAPNSISFLAFDQGSSTSGYKKTPGTLKMLTNFRSLFRVPERYQYLHKFRTFPYAVIELTNAVGQSVLLQPERVHSDNLEVSELSTLTPTNPRITAYVKDYGSSGVANYADFTTDQEAGDFDPGEGLNHGITIDSFPRTTILSNAGLMYMATNAHSIAQSRQAASWGMNKSQMGAQTAYGQATQGMNAATDQLGVDISAMDQHRALQNQNSTISAVLGGVQSVGMGAAAGPAGIAMGAASAISGGINAGIQQNTNNQSFAIDSARMGQSAQIQAGSAAYMRDTNKALADSVSTGDYQQTIAGINAKIQDSEIVSPHVAGASGGDMLTTLYRYQGFLIRFKQLPVSSMRAIGEYWLRYGYAVRQWTNPYRLHVMSHFTYWKMKDATIFSRQAPETSVMTIRGIFERGTTVWRHPDLIGKTDPGDNVPLVNDYLGLKRFGESW